MAPRRIVLAFAVLVAALAAAHPAAGARPACGTTITRDTGLRADLRGCEGTALVIGADGVTLDLRGHAVEGAIVAKGREHVAIRNGSVAGDVRLEDVAYASVSRLRVRAGSIECLRSAGCALTRNVVTGGSIALARMESGIPNSIRRNTVRAALAAGISVARTDTTTVAENTVRKSGAGIELSHAADLRVVRNRAVRNAGDGVTGSFGSTATIVRNVLASNGGDGISLRVWGGDTVVARNVLARNSQNGLLGAAVAHWSVLRNVVTGNGEAGIAITGSVEDVAVTRNDVRANAGPAIDAAPGVTIR